MRPAERRSRPTILILRFHFIILQSLFVNRQALYFSLSTLYFLLFFNGLLTGLIFPFYGRLLGGAALAEAHIAAAVGTPLAEHAIRATVFFCAGVGYGAGFGFHAASPFKIRQYCKSAA
jgi:hypothetical protein